MIDFLGIGAQKCGTTWLYERLKSHPLVCFPAGKEVHFWDSKRGLGVEWWTELFPPAPGFRQGEITPAYACLDIDAISAVKAAAPSLKLFYSIRNPIARAWSSALMALGRAELMIDEVSDQWFIDHFESRGSRRRGAYLECMENWLSVFPESSFHLIVLDDLQRDPRRILLELATHIDVDGAPLVDAEEALLHTPIFEGPRLTVRPTLLAHLRLLYSDEIEALGRRLGRDFGSWTEWDGRL